MVVADIHYDDLIVELISFLERAIMTVKINASVD